MSQSPQTGQFNSYAYQKYASDLADEGKSQSPQTGQFNSYKCNIFKINDWSDLRLNPLKRVNSILTGLLDLVNLQVELSVSIPSNGSIQFLRCRRVWTLQWQSLVSIPSNGSIQFLPIPGRRKRVLSKRLSLNPLKRVNSILT